MKNNMISLTESLCSIVEIKTTLKINYTSIKYFFKDIKLKNKSKMMSLNIYLKAFKNCDYHSQDSDYFWGSEGFVIGTENTGL